MVGLVVSEVVSRFLSHVEEVGKPNTIRTYRRFLVPFAKRFANVPANALTSSQVEAYAKRPTWSDTTRSHTLKTIQTALRFAGVTLTLKTPRKSSRGIEAVVSEDDVNAIVDASRGDFGFFYRFLSLTGCRPAEAMSLRFDHVQVTQGVAILSEHKTAQKTGKKRLIFLSDDALAIVERQRLRYASGHVFQTSTRKAFTLNNACNILWRINKRIGTKATLYGMRHTFATRLLAEGVPDAHVAALLGHASTAMLHKHYAHVTAHAGVLREALRKSFGDNK
ncbi:tyrosine-type recombinase/integrase [soil metagenome]